jgi:hypothetical protein
LDLDLDLDLGCCLLLALFFLAGPRVLLWDRFGGIDAWFIIDTEII